MLECGSPRFRGDSLHCSVLVYPALREGFVYLLKVSDIRSFQIHGEGGVSGAWCELQLFPRAVAPPHPAWPCSGLTIHTDKISHQKMPFTTWKNTQNVNPTKLALKI